jgi:uncharacterized protein
MKRCLILFVCAVVVGFGSAFAADNPPDISPLAGVWQGSLKAGSVSLRIVFNVGIRDGLLRATMDSPDQGGKGLPVTKVVFADSRVLFEMKAISGTYEGTMSADGFSIDGTWKQAGSEFPIVLEKMARDAGGQAADSSLSSTIPLPEALLRPQEPEEPYPYRVVEVSFTNTDAGIDLSGTLNLPEGSGPFPAVVLVTGSGPQNRDEEIFGHKPFLVIADYLARRGIAALRYDDRGVGASKGKFSAATTFDFAADAASAVAFLAARPGIDAGKVGIVGHSEGAIIATIEASRDPAVSFIVMLAGTGIRGVELLFLQGAAIARAAGADEASIAGAKKINASLYAIAMRTDEEAAHREEIISTLKSEPQAGLIADQLLSPWFRTFLALNPAEYLAKVKMPVLAMNGSKDLQVPAEENLPAIGKALESAGNRRFTLLKLDRLNHLFQHAGTGLPEEYATIAETFAPEALSAMGDWITSIVSGGE